MPDPCPELIFVAGPQAGQRAVVMASPTVAGRSPACDIDLAEQSVSRQQMRLSPGPDGWVLENLSSNGTKVNGKTYKRRKVILDTGDIIGVGRQTVLLFVAAEDDPEAALRAYREVQPAPPAEEPPAAQPPPAPQEPPREPAPTAPVAPMRAEAAAEDAEAAAKRAKRKKYIIGFSIYAALLLVVVIVLIWPGDGDGDQRAAPRDLKASDIRQALEAPIRNLPTSAALAAEMLAKAETFYAARSDPPANLYRAVKCFKLHLAYKGGGGFAENRHYRMFEQARRDLVERVVQLYVRAYENERAERWPEAENLFQEALAMLPVKEEPHPERRHVVFENVIEHLAYVRRMRSDRE
jgi:hypothetical protein